MKEILLFSVIISSLKDIINLNLDLLQDTLLSWTQYCPIKWERWLVGLESSEEVEMLSHCSGWLFVIPWTIAHQAPLFMEFPRPRILEWVAISFSREKWMRKRKEVHPTDNDGREEIIQSLHVSTRWPGHSAELYFLSRFVKGVRKERNICQGKDSS